MTKKEHLEFENQESLSTWGLKHPERIIFDIDPDVAKSLRRHCAIEGLHLGTFVGNLIKEHLIALGKMSLKNQDE